MGPEIAAAPLMKFVAVFVVAGLIIYAIGWMHFCRLKVNVTAVTIGTAGTPGSSAGVIAQLEEKKGVFGSWTAIAGAAYTVQSKQGNTKPTTNPNPPGITVMITSGISKAGSDIVNVTASGGACKNITQTVDVTIV